MSRKEETFDEIDIEHLPPLPDDDGGFTDSFSGDDGMSDDSELGWDDFADTPGGGNGADGFDAFGLRGIGLHRHPKTPDASIPIWEQFHLKAASGEAYQLRIERENDVGQKEYMGKMGASSSVEALIKRYRKAGTYWVMPVDTVGKPMRPQGPYVITIPDDNPFLMKIMSEGNGGGNGFVPGAFGGAPYYGGGQAGMQPVLDYFLEQQKLQLEERDKNQTREEEEQARIDEQRAKLHQAQAALSADTQKNTADMFGKLFDREGVRNANMTERMLAMNAEDRAKAEQAHARELERARLDAADREKDKSRFFEGMTSVMERGLKSRELDIQEQRLRDERDLKERRLDLDRLRLQEQQRMEREEKRTQEFYQRMHELDQKRMDAGNPMSMATNLLTMGLGFVTTAKGLGIDIPEMVQGFVRSEGSKTWFGELTGLVKEGINAYKEIETSRGEQVGLEVVDEYLDEHGNVIPPEQLQAEARAQIPMQQQAPVQQQGAMGAMAAAAGGQGHVAPIQQQQSYGGPAAMTGTGRQSAMRAASIDANGGQVGPVPDGGFAPPPEGQGQGQVAPVQGFADIAGLKSHGGSKDMQAQEINGAAGIDPVAHLDAGTKKSARRAIRGLVEALSVEPDVGKWQALVITHMAPARAALEPFLMAMGIRRAATEAGAGGDLIDKFISTLDAMGFGTDIPR